MEFHPVALQPLGKEPADAKVHGVLLFTSSFSLMFFIFESAFQINKAFFFKLYISVCVWVCYWFERNTGNRGKKIGTFP